MNKKTISAKPRAASKSPLSPRGAATKNQTAKKPKAKTPHSIKAEAIFDLIKSSFEEKACGGPDGVECATHLIRDGVEALLRIAECVTSGDAARIRAALILDEANHDLATALSVFESQYFMQRGWYGGEKMPTLESEWEEFDPAWYALLRKLQERFPTFAGRIEDLRLAFQEYAHGCDHRNLHLEEPNAKAKELGKAHDEYKAAEKRAVCLFADMAFHEIPETDEENEEYKRLNKEITERQEQDKTNHHPKKSVEVLAETIIKNDPEKYPTISAAVKKHGNYSTIRTNLSRVKNHGTIKQHASGKRARAKKRKTK